MWRKRKAKARCAPYYKILHGDFMDTFKHLDIDWGGLPCKMISSKINDYKYGGTIDHKHLRRNEYPLVIKNLKSKHLSESMRDVRWFMSVGQLPVRAVVSWSWS